MKRLIAFYLTALLAIVVCEVDWLATEFEHQPVYFAIHQRFDRGLLFDGSLEAPGKPGGFVGISGSDNGQDGQTKPESTDVMQDEHTRKIASVDLSPGDGVSVGITSQQIQQSSSTESQQSSATDNVPGENQKAKGDSIAVSGPRETAVTMTEVSGKDLSDENLEQGHSVIRVAGGATEPSASNNTRHGPLGESVVNDEKPAEGTASQPVTLVGALYHGGAALDSNDGTGEGGGSTGERGTAVTGGTFAPTQSGSGGGTVAAEKGYQLGLPSIDAKGDQQEIRSGGAGGVPQQTDQSASSVGGVSGSQDSFSNLGTPIIDTVRRLVLRGGSTSLSGIGAGGAALSHPKVAEGGTGRDEDRRDGVQGGDLSAGSVKLANNSGSGDKPYQINRPGSPEAVAEIGEKRRIGFTESVIPASQQSLVSVTGAFGADSGTLGQAAQPRVLESDASKIKDAISDGGILEAPVGVIGKDSSHAVHHGGRYAPGYPAPIRGQSDRSAAYGGDNEFGGFGYGSYDGFFSGWPHIQLWPVAFGTPYNAPSHPSAYNQRGGVIFQ